MPCSEVLAGRLPAGCLGRQRPPLHPRPVSRATPTTGRTVHRNFLVLGVEWSGGALTCGGGGCGRGLAGRGRGVEPESDVPGRGVVVGAVVSTVKAVRMPLPAPWGRPYIPGGGGSGATAGTHQLVPDPPPRGPATAMRATEVPPVRIAVRLRSHRRTSPQSAACTVVSRGGCALPIPLPFPLPTPLPDPCSSLPLVCAGQNLNSASLKPAGAKCAGREATQD